MTNYSVDLSNKVPRSKFQIYLYVFINKTDIHTIHTYIYNHEGSRKQLLHEKLLRTENWLALTKKQ